MRLDQYLHQKLNISSRSRSSDLIKMGSVLVNGNVIKKPSFNVSAEDKVEVEDIHYVSRAGIKLEGALEHLGLPVAGLHVLDVGQSTGGFSDCLLQRGVSRIVGVDVGKGQLHDKVKSDERVTAFEGINAKDSLPEMLPVDLIVMDVSFISITKVLPSALAVLKPSGQIISLVKPQFELETKGVLVGEADYKNVEEKIKQACGSLGLKILDYFSSGILGKDGNKEFFIYASKN